MSSSSSVGDLFAGSIAYADNRLYVGARQADGNKGQVHVFLKNSSSWNEIEIIPSPHPSGGGLFSYWIDACADLLVVGARDLDSAFLFRWNETTLSHVAAGSLTPNNPPSGSFGTRTVFSDDCNSIVLCAPQDVGTGSGFLFVRNMSTFLFEETQKLLPPGGGAGDEFCTDAAFVANDTWLVVAAKNVGVLYAYRRNGSSFVFEEQVSDARFQRLVNLDAHGSVLVAGAPGFDDDGLVVVITVTANGLNITSELRGDGLDTTNGFGTALTITESVAAIGAEHDDPGGAVYFFDRRSQNWSDVAKVTATSSGDLVGGNFAFEDATTFFATAIGADGGLGAVYYFGLACDGSDTDLCPDGLLLDNVCTDSSIANMDVCDELDNDCDPATPDGADDPRMTQLCDGPTCNNFTCVGGLPICDNSVNYCPATPSPTPVLNGTVFDERCAVEETKINLPLILAVGSLFALSIGLFIASCVVGGENPRHFSVLIVGVGIAE